MLYQQFKLNGIQNEYVGKYLREPTHTSSDWIPNSDETERPTFHVMGESKVSMFQFAKFTYCRSELAQKKSSKKFAIHIREQIFCYILIQISPQKFNIEVPISS